jgi:branched-chain amino acid transport system permease protein
MEIVVQTVVNIALLASVYILVGLGFAFILNLLGIFNLAHGAVFMSAAYICYMLRTSTSLPIWSSILIPVVGAGIAGILVERLLFRPFKGDFNRTMMVCITFSTVLVTTFNLALGTQQISIPSVIPGTIGTPPYSVDADRVLALLAGVVLLTATMLFVNKTKWGAQMQAVTQNRQGAALQGIRFGQVALLACSIGFALAAVAGIFMGILYNLSPWMGDTTLIKVLILVVLAGMGSFSGIFIVGGLLGLMYGGLPMILPGAVVDAVASALVLGLLLVRPQGFFGHEIDVTEAPGMREATAPSDTGHDRGARVRRLTVIGALVAIVVILPVFISGSYFMHVLILAFIYCVVAGSFRTITISGQFSIAHGAFMGIGAYVAGMASVWLHWPPWVTIPLGAIAACVLGAALAYPFARLRTVYYAMGTLFLGYVIINLFTAGGKITGSTSGVAGIEPLFMSPVPYYYLFLGIMVLSFAAMYRFEFSRIGVTLKAIAQSHSVASSVGINERRWRILAVGFGCFFAGLVGAAYAHYNMVASPTSFGLSATLWIIMYALVGGLYKYWGPIIGVAVLMVVPEFFRDLKGYLPYVSAFILIVIAFTLPGGLASVPGLVRERLSRSRNDK